MDIGQEVVAYLEGTQETELLMGQRPRSLRPSSFPYCPLVDLYKSLNPEPDTMPMSGQYYVTVGTTAHTAFQRWAGIGGRMLGNWKCNRCKTTEALTAKHKCPKCKRPMKYVELTVKAFRNLTGHVDGVYRAKNGKYYIIDYKTSSMRSIENHQKYGDRFPYLKNKQQIVAYTALVEHTFGIEISGWVLIYVARDNPCVRLPIYSSINAAQKRAVMTRLEKWDTQFSTVTRLLRTRSTEGLKRLIEDKPCKDYEQYMKVYHSPFKACPLSGACFAPKRLYQLLSDDL